MSPDYSAGVDRFCLDQGRALLLKNAECAAESKSNAFGSYAFVSEAMLLLFTLWASDWNSSGILPGLALLAFLDTASWSQWTCFFSIIHSKERQERGFSKFCKWHWWILMRAACSLLRVCSCCHSFSLHWWPCHAAMRAKQRKRGMGCLIYIYISICCSTLCLPYAC